MIKNIFAEIGDHNPQLLREIKGRLNGKNLIITTLISVVGQALIMAYFINRLPIDVHHTSSRYCSGADLQDGVDPSYYLHSDYNKCVKDLLGNFMIIRELWWLDIFMALSVIAIFGLLILGTYMLIADLAKEESQGTLNFIRLSPQSSFSIITGKILGVPIPLFFMAALAGPLHLWAGLSASIPLKLVLGFDAVLIAACGFFYSAAVVYSLVSSGLRGFQPWLGSGAVFILLSFTYSQVASDNFSIENTFNWLILFYPGSVFPYLAKSTFLPPSAVDYINYDSVKNLSFYGMSLFEKPSIGIPVILGNFALWSYWIWQGIGRSFHNPLKTLITKRHSYLLSLTFIFTVVGFTQLITKYEGEQLANFAVLQCFIFALFIFLIGALSPQRQALIDWAAYRHRKPKHERNLLKDLFWGEKSPATLAIALNVAIVTLYMVLFIILLPSGEHKTAFLINQLVNASLMLILAVLAQLLILNSKQKVGAGVAFFVAGLGILPIFPIAIFFNPHSTPAVWLFTPFSWVAVGHATATTVFMSMLTQWATFALLTGVLNRQLTKAGESQTKALLSAKL